MAYINDEVIEKIKDTADIVNIVSDYVQLKKSGSNYIGLCPFHNEKTPSFTVSESKQIFHCFGCGEGGDALKFIMKRENLDFLDAIKFLGDKLGIEINVDENGFNSKNAEDRNKTFEINKITARFFYNNLYNNGYALKYLNNRKISSKVIRQFGLGFALDSWDSLYNYLKSKNYDDEDILRAGLINKRNEGSGYYDKFRNRIIFPIIDTKGRVIAFGGRVMDNSVPKYLNSPDTNVFIKGHHLYGVNLVNKYSNRKRILLTEGYMDVISLFERGINYVVASLGTAFTEHQAKLIKRFGDEIYICYDSDDAGIKAASRAIDVLLGQDVQPKIILLPKGMDPDDFIKEKGMSEFEKKFGEALSYIDFKVYNIKSKYNLENLDEKIKFTREVARIIKSIKSPIEQDAYIEKISKETEISKSAIESEIKGKNIQRLDKKNVKAENIRPVKTVLPSSQFKAEINLIRIMMKAKDYYELITGRLSLNYFKNSECKYLYSLLDLVYEESENLDEKVLFSNIMDIPNIDKNIVNLIFSNEIPYAPSNINRIIEELIQTILDNDFNDRKTSLLLRIGELENKERTSEENDLLNKLLMDLNELIKSKSN